MSREALHALLRDLPPELQRAVQHAVTRCRPHYRPRLYAHDWREELYHEAACAACEAWRSYDPAKSSLYAWGLRVISQRLHRFCEEVWAACQQEVDWPRDEETDEEREFEDEAALAVVEETVLCGQVRSALAQLREGDCQLLQWYFGAGLSEREIATKLGKSKTWVHHRLADVLIGTSYRYVRWTGWGTRVWSRELTLWWGTRASCKPPTI
ncbi:MAG: sigma-70 family RNA polymerase sigma factor [candidate division KSB1 bacterium]|nr:sigma-70 family RNA polymerase sigma factor [candidate division KSB1 bacterium]